MIMVVSVIESGLSRFQSPNSLVHLRTLWTWAALIVAFVATFSSLLRRTKRAILRFRKVKSVNSHLHSRTFDDDDDDDVSSCSSDDESDDEEEEEEMVTDSDEEVGDFEEVQGQNGNSGRQWAWPDLARDGSVVKFWDGLGLGLGFGRPSGSISLLDLDRDEILRSFRCGSDDTPAVHVASPETFLSAGEEGVRFWDARAPPAEFATWQAEGLGRLVGIGGEDNEVYLGDDVGKLTVVDLRKVRSPLADTWWCRDVAVTAGDGDGLVSWCRNAARCLTRL